MAEATDGARAIEARLGSVETEVVGLRGEVGELRGEVGGLRGELQKLRVLEEENAQRIKLIAEGHGATLDAHTVTLSAHGVKLDEIAAALKPLAQIHDFVKRVADDHEIRIVALESRAGGKQPEG